MGISTKGLDAMLYWAIVGMVLTVINGLGAVIWLAWFIYHHVVIT